ncbi:hypothetical protein TRVA0_028S01662 [Trichomonascus vanleenenianus]|uniref:glycoside hydrolase family 75 protein n=1 Tax=Trichomonascus vanleenenianus TaxID=2268995 RepID=UPI003EC95F69
MKFQLTSLIAIALVPGSVAARSVPDYVQAFYDQAKANSCEEPIKNGFRDADYGPRSWSYCEDGVEGKAIFITGGKGQLANMDIDCDGALSGGDGRCGYTGDTQGQTAFRDEVRKYGIRDLNPNYIPYVVFGNEGEYSPTFDPREYGVQPLSVMAVVCNGKLLYGVWGDTNGDDGPPLVGEASLSLATECFGKSMDNDNGHVKKDVLYIAFVGNDAVPGCTADWKARSFHRFEDSIAAIGDRLIQRLNVSNY